MSLTARKVLLLLTVTSLDVIDGWTKNDLIYIWKDKGALQFAGKPIVFFFRNIYNEKSFPTTRGTQLF